MPLVNFAFPVDSAKIGGAHLTEEGKCLLKSSNNFLSLINKLYTAILPLYTAAPTAAAAHAAVKVSIVRYYGCSYPLQSAARAQTARFTTSAIVAELLLASLAPRRIPASVSLSLSL